MRVAIVGYGVMGKHHARVCRALGHEVVTCDPFNDEADSLDLDLAVHAVIVATPVECFERVASIAAIRNLPVLVEKPGCTAVDGWTGYVERFNPVVRELQQRISEVVTVKTERLGPAARSNVSPAIDLATHDLDILASLGLDRTPIAHMQRGGHLSALLECGTLEASHASPVKSRKITVYGSPHLHADLIEQRLWVDGNEIPVVKAEPLAEQDAAFLRGEPCPVSVSEAAGTLAIAETLSKEHDGKEHDGDPESLREVRDTIGRAVLSRAPA